MADWPTSSLKTTKTEIPITESLLLDPTIRSRKEDGTVTTRQRFPAVPRVWKFTLRNICTDDKATLKNFEHTTVSYGSGTFNWFNDTDNMWYVVRMNKPFVFTNDNVGVLWRTPIELAEATATQ